MGTDMVLSSDYIGEVANDRRLDVREYTAEVGLVLEWENLLARPKISG